MRFNEASLSCMPELLLENSDPFPARTDGSQGGRWLQRRREVCLERDKALTWSLSLLEITAPLGRSLLKTLDSKGAQSNWSSKSLLAEFQH